MPDRDEVLVRMVGYVLAFLFLAALGYLVWRLLMLPFYLLHPIAVMG